MEKIRRSCLPRRFSNTCVRRSGCGIKFSQCPSRRPLPGARAPSGASHPEPRLRQDSRRNKCPRWGVTRRGDCVPQASPTKVLCDVPERSWDPWAGRKRRSPTPRTQQSRMLHLLAPWAENNEKITSQTWDDVRDPPPKPVASPHIRRHDLPIPPQQHHGWPGARRCHDLHPSRQQA